MPGCTGPPAGVKVIAVAVGAKGLASLAMAAGLAVSDPARLWRAGAPTAEVSAVVGLLLLHRAYAIWALHPGAWLATLALVLVDGATAALVVAQGRATATVWLSLAVAVVVGLYLLRPATRALFVGGRAGR